MHESDLLLGALGQSGDLLVNPPGFLDFFAGCGLVTEALKGLFETVWSNDNSEKKAAVFRANHDFRTFHLGDIAGVRGAHLPDAVMAWASFPCQDLSLAGRQGGIRDSRSGLVWEWLRIMNEAGVRRPPILALENVVGLVSAKRGEHYRTLHRELAGLGYRVGAMILDAILWLPQSRPRVFIVAVRSDISTSTFEADGPSWNHPKSLTAAAKGLESWVWWALPRPPERTTVLSDLIDWHAPVDDSAASRRNLKLIPAHHQAQLIDQLAGGRGVAPGYKRTRGRQVLELRFDGVAGCLRTPKGGSSRQHLVLQRDGRLATRLITVREAARLMGAPDTYRLPGGYNDAYYAMGDAVAVPVVRHLGENLLRPLADLLLKPSQPIPGFVQENTALQSPD
jgi:DNA (cytosine-5)-methyltransferase 1